MKNKNILAGGIVLVLIIIVGIYMYTQKVAVAPTEVPTETSDMGTTTSSGSPTSTPTGEAPTGLAANSGPVSITDVSISSADPSIEVYQSSTYQFIAMYPKNWSRVVASAATPTLYMSDREFIHCVPEQKKAQGCAPIVSFMPSDKSGHGVSVYVLDNAKVEAMGGGLPSYARVYAENNHRFEVIYTDMYQANATVAQNSARMEVASIFLKTFTLTQQ
jgi:hypothetical protein